MSKKFYAVHRETGERWKSAKEVDQYLMMWDSGYLAVVTDYGWDGCYIEPLDTKIWRTVVRFPNSGDGGE